jgi:hypothetical protein
MLYLKQHCTSTSPTCWAAATCWNNVNGRPTDWNLQIQIFASYTCPLSVGRPILSDTSPIALQTRIRQHRLITPSFNSFPPKETQHSTDSKLTVSPANLFLHPIEGHKTCTSQKIERANPVSPPNISHIIALSVIRASTLHNFCLLPHKVWIACRDLVGEKNLNLHNKM